MKIYINIKQLGKKRDLVQGKPFDLPENPDTVVGLISLLVREEVKKFNDRPDEETFLLYLTPHQIEEKSEAGKVGFDVHYNTKKADPEEAVRDALLAFQDGLFRVFLNDSELEMAHQSLSLQENDQLTFIRLTMLAGRMW